MNELQIFQNPEFGEVRTIEEDGKVLFCAKDVAAALGYKNTRDAINRHCKGVVKRDGVSHTTNQHGTTTEQTVEMAFIPEGDIYRLAAKSELPGAERFESWIFDEVLPSIRKHGGYLTPEKVEEALLNPDTLIRLATDLKAERQRRKLLETENAQQKQLLAEYSPKASYYDVVLQTPDALSTSQIAKDYGKSAKWLNSLLHELGVQYNQGGVWLLYQKYAEQGYTRSKTHTYCGEDGLQHSKLHTYWTQKGRLFVYNLLKEQGILPLIEVKEQRAG